jgi:hypothetical protein
VFVTKNDIFLEKGLGERTVQLKEVKETGANKAK